MPQFFVFAKSDNSFIVSAESREALQDEVDAIRDNHPSYYKEHLAPGYYVVEARNLKEAKANRSEVTYDLPLFRQNPPEDDD